MDQVITDIPQLSIEEAERIFLPSFQLPYRTAPWLGEIYEWAAKNVELPHGYVPPGMFNVNLSPYLIEPFKAINDPAIRQVNIMAPPRSGKTLLAEITLLFLIANAPGHILWVQSTEKSKKKMGDARMAKLLRLCPPVAKLLDPNDRHAITQNRYRFMNGVEVHLANATLKSLQSFGYKYIVFDEVWMADPGLIGEVKARIGEYENTCKIILISQGGDLTRNPEWPQEFNKGIVKEYGFNCPKCKLPQPYYFNHRLNKTKEWAGLVWPRNAQTYVDGSWVIEEAAKQTVLKCINPACQHSITDTPENRDHLFKNYCYITTKENGDAEKLSFHYNSLCSPNITFAKLAKEWLEADKVYDETGESLAKDQFKQKRLAETPGRERQLELLELNTLVLEDGKEWKPNTVRFLTVDVQRKAPRFWYVCREWCKDGDSRKVGHGSCHSWEEVEAIRQKFNVKWHRVFVDAGDGQNEDEIFTHCAMAGDWGRVAGRPVWLCYNATKGFGNYSFKENGNKPWKIDQVKVNLPPLPKYKQVYGCNWFKWSNPRIKTILQHLRDGKGAKWLSNDDDPEYKKQMVSEIPLNVKHGITYQKVNENDPNEYWDCEALQVLAALYYGALTVGVKAEEQEDNFVKA